MNVLSLLPYAPFYWSAAWAPATLRTLMRKTADVQLSSVGFARAERLVLLQKRKATPAMAVSSFLDKGGGAALPRNRQDRKDKEKDKRMRGQSSHISWKSEAEMALRQQYDS